MTVTRPLCLVESHTLDAAARRERSLFCLTHVMLSTVAYWDWTRIDICIHHSVFHLYWSYLLWLTCATTTYFQIWRRPECGPDRVSNQSCSVSKNPFSSCNFSAGYLCWKGKSRFGFRTKLCFLLINFLPIIKRIPQFLKKGIISLSFSLSLSLKVFLKCFVTA